jgi:hypothetical protein
MGAGVAVPPMEIPIGTIQELYGHGSAFPYYLNGHGFILGKTGTGKSTTLERIFITAIRLGLGGAFFDPHGISVDFILAHLPKNRTNDVVLIDPQKDRVPGINILEGENKNLRVDQAIDLLANFRGSTSWGARSDYITRNLGRAVVQLIAGCTLLHLDRVFTDDDYRASIRANTTDQFILKFFQAYEEKWSDKQRDEASAAPLNKLDVLNHPLVRTIVGQRHGLNFRELIDQRKIILFRLPVGEIGQEVASVLGAIGTAGLLHGAMEREITSSSAQFITVADEIQLFIRGLATEQLLSGARKYRLSYIGGTQTLEQMPEGAPEAFFGNSTNTLIGRVGAKDAERAAEELATISNTSPPAAMIQNLRLPDAGAGAYWYGKHKTKGAVLFEALPPVKKRGNEAWRPTVIRQSLQNYSSDKAEIESKLQRFLAGVSSE